MNRFYMIATFTDKVLNYKYVILYCTLRSAHFYILVVKFYKHYFSLAKYEMSPHDYLYLSLSSQSKRLPLEWFDNWM